MFASFFLLLKHFMMVVVFHFLHHVTSWANISSNLELNSRWSPSRSELGRSPPLSDVFFSSYVCVISSDFYFLVQIGSTSLRCHKTHRNSQRNSIGERVSISGHHSFEIFGPHASNFDRIRNILVTIIRRHSIRCCWKVKWIRWSRSNLMAIHEPSGICLAI